MSLLTTVSIVLRLCAIPWVDLAVQEQRAVVMAQEVGAERLAIQARFSRAKAFTLAGVDETVDSITYENRLAQIRSSGDDATAELVEELQRQAEAEERWATFLAEQNASVQLTPGDAPTQIPAPRAPPPQPTTYATTTGAQPPLGSGATGSQPPLGSGATGSQPPLGPGTPGAQPPPGSGATGSQPPAGAPTQPAPAPPPGPGGSGGGQQPPAASSGPAAPSRTEDSRFMLSIPKIGLDDVPIIETDIFNQERFLTDLKSGVAHAFCHPNEPCKSVIFGHSSGYANDTSAYKRVFARLNELQVGDRITVNYRSRLYTYEVFRKEIVAPDAVGILKNYEWEELTLFTCWPINTWRQRLVVYTKRI